MMVGDAGGTGKSGSHMSWNGCSMRSMLYYGEHKTMITP